MSLFGIGLMVVPFIFCQICIYDTFVCLGDVGKADYLKEIKAKRKILI